MLLAFSLPLRKKVLTPWSYRKSRLKQKATKRGPLDNEAIKYEKGNGIPLRKFIKNLLAKSFPSFAFTAMSHGKTRQQNMVSPKSFNKHSGSLMQEILFLSILREGF